MLDKKKLKSANEILNKEIKNTYGESKKLGNVVGTKPNNRNEEGKLRQEAAKEIEKSNRLREIQRRGASVSGPSINIMTREGTTVPMRSYKDSGPINSTSLPARIGNAVMGIEKSIGASFGLMGETLNQAQDVKAIENQLEMQKNAISQLNYLSGYKHRGDKAALEADPEYQQAMKKFQSASRVIEAYRNRAADTDTEAFKNYAEAMEYRDKALEGLEGPAKFVGEGLYSIGQNIAVLPTAVFTPAAPLTILGVQAAADKAYQTAMEGKSANEAFSRGLISGSIEGATEKLGLDRLTGIVKGGRRAGQSAVRAAAENALKQSATEGGEEAASYTLNYAADRLAGDENAEFSVKDLGYSAGLGMFSGGLMGGGASVIGGRRGGNNNERNTRQNVNGGGYFENNGLTENENNTGDFDAGLIENQTEQAVNEAFERAAENLPNNETPVIDVNTANEETAANREPDIGEFMPENSREDIERYRNLFDVSRYGVGGQNSLLAYYDGLTDPETYQNEYERYYNMGLAGNDENAFERAMNTPSPVFNQRRKANAYIGGQADMAAAAANRANRELLTAETAEMTRRQNPTAGNFEMSGDERTIAQTVGDITGLKINLVSGLPENANAQYMNKRGEININIKGDGFLPSLGHEVLHFVRDYNPEGYGELRNIVLNFAARSENKSLDRYIQDYRDTYAKAGEYTNEMLTEEMTADAMQRAFENDGFIDYISRRKQSLGQRIIDFLKDVAEGVKRAINGIRTNTYNEYSEISEDIEKNYADVKGLYTKFYNAMEKAGYEFKQGYSPEDIFENMAENNVKTEISGIPETDVTARSRSTDYKNSPPSKHVQDAGNTADNIMNESGENVNGDNEENIEKPEYEDELWEYFSLSPENTADYRKIEKENSKLKEQVKNLKEQFKLTKGIRLDPKDVRRKVNEIKKRYGSNYDSEALTEQFTRLVEYMENGENINDEIALKAAAGMAREVLSSSELIDNEAYVNYKELRDYLTTNIIKVSDTLKEDITSEYDGFNSFRRQYFGRLNLSLKDGNSIDSIYQELSEKYPEFFNADENISEIEELNSIVDALESIKPKITTFMDYNNVDMDEAAYIVGQQILQDFADTKRAAPTFADKAKARYDALKAEYEENLKSQYKKLRRENFKLEQEVLRQRDIRSFDRAKRRETAQRTKLLNLSKRLSKMRTTPENMKRVEELIKDVDIIAKSITDGKFNELTEIKALVREAEKNNEDFSSSNVPKKIRDQLERLEKKQINDLSIEEVEALTESLIQLEHEIRTKDKLLGEQYKKDVYQTAEGWEKEIEGSGGRGRSRAKQLINQYNVAQLKAENFFRLISGYKDSGDIMKIYRGFEDGERKYMKFKQAAGEKFEKYIENREFMREITGPKAKEIDISQIVGRDKGSVKITPAMRISLYLHSLNHANMGHIDGTWYVNKLTEEESKAGGKRELEKAIGGGVTIPDIKMYKQGRGKEAYTNGIRLNLTRSQIKKIAEGMSEEEKRLAADINSFLNTETKAAINETSIVLDGVERARVNNYFPIRTNQNFTKAENAGIVFDSTLEGMGMLKERSGATNPVYLEDALVALDRQVENTAKYSGFAIPVRNLNKVHNVTFSDYRSSVKDIIEKNWGENAEKYINDFLSDVQNGRKSGDRSLLDGLRGAYAQSVLTLNPGTVIKQASGITAAVNNIDTDVLARAMVKTERGLKKEIDENTPIYWNRRQGNYIREAANAKINRTWDKRFDGKLKRAFFGWLDKADELTIEKIWTASKLQIEKNNKNNPLFEKGSEEYWKEVTDLFERTVWETQPNYSAVQRGNIMKSTNEIVKTFTMFGTQSNVNFNLIYDRVGEMRARKKEYNAAVESKDKARIEAAKKEMAKSRVRLVRAAASEVIQQGSFAALDILVPLLGLASRERLKDDEGEITEESLIKAYGKSALSAVSGTFFMGNELFNIVNSAVTGDTYYGIDNVKYSTINDIGNSVINVVDSIKEYVLVYQDETRDLAYLKERGETGEYNRVLDKFVSESGYSKAQIEKAVDYYNNGGAMKELGGAAFDLVSVLSVFNGVPLKNIQRLGQIPVRWGEMLNSKKTADIIKNSDLSLTDKYKSIRNINDASDEVTKKALLELIVEADRKRDKNAYTYMYTDMVKNGIYTDSKIRTEIGNAYKDELKKLPEMAAVIEAQKEGNTKKYMENVKKLQNMGYQDKYIMSVLNSYTKEAEKVTDKTIAEDAESIYNDDGSAYTYEIAFDAINGGDMTSYNEIKDEVVSSGTSETTFINGVLKEQNKWAEETGQTVYSTSALFDELAENGESRKYNEIYENLIKYGKTEKSIESSISSNTTELRKLYYEARLNGNYDDYEKYRSMLLKVGVTPAKMESGYKQYLKKLEEDENS